MPAWRVAKKAFVFGAFVSATSPQAKTFGRVSSAICSVGLILMWPVGDIIDGERLEKASEDGF